MDAMMAIAGTLLFSICAALGIEWAFLAGAFRFMSATMARKPAPQRLTQACRTGRRGPAFWAQ